MKSLVVLLALLVLTGCLMVLALDFLSPWGTFFVASAFLAIFFGARSLRKS